MGNKGRSLPNAWGGYDHYDENGHKTGRSMPNAWGGYTHYDEKGHKSGSSMPDGWGGYKNYDSEGHRTGSSTSDGLGGFRNSDSTGACYIATCAYGSYDCPEVWVLRRFRDDVLARSGFGKRFIRTYYSVSPKLVKAFGSSRRVRRIWRSCLDPLVSVLRKRGFSGDPYGGD